MKKVTLMLTIVAVCIFIGGILYAVRAVLQVANLSPYDFLVRSMKNDGIDAPSEMLYQASTDEGEYIIFYKDQRSIVACAVVKKKPLSYHLSRISRGIRPTAERGELPADLRFSSYNKGMEWVFWGIIKDSSVARVLLNGREATIVEVKGLRICYATGKESKPITNFDYRFFDGQGNPIVQSIGQKGDE